MGKRFNGIPVLFENNFCLVLNKPQGLPVQGGEGVRVSLDSILSKEIHPRPFLVHRLDRETSGIILVAKTKEAARFFSASFAGRANIGLVKRYQGVCSGSFKQEQGVFRLNLDVRGKKKESETFFRLISNGNCKLPDGELPCSLLELELGTGRMHQIRRHLAISNHPLLGDDKYGDFPLNKKLKKALGLKHLLLHASCLIFPPSPYFPGGLDITSPLPEYFSLFLETLV